MPSPFHGIDVASRALRSFQRALDVTGNNLANVNTAGYTRQTVEFGQSQPILFWSGGAHALGTGMDITSVNRIRDLFLESRRSGAESDLGRMRSQIDHLRNTQALFAEPGGSGIAESLDKFFNAWSSLATNPGDRATRMQVQQAGQDLTAKVRSTYTQMSDQRRQVRAEIGHTFDGIDRLTSRIAELNSEIRAKSVTGGTPNDLLDVRDRAVRELSQLVDIQTFAQPDGSMTVNMNGLPLVDGGGARPVPRQYSETTQQLLTAGDPVNVRNGRLMGLFQTLNFVEGSMGRLDTLANTLRTQVNLQHAAGTNALGMTGVNFFNDASPQTGAVDFTLDAAVLADPDAIAAGASGAAGDGGIALSLSRLRDEPIAALGNVTVSRFFADLVTEVGRTLQARSESLETFAAVAEQVDRQIQSVSGVSIDDEMANMLRFQRSYQAAARALTVFDQMTEDLINMLRR
jgi:flagellar hook-associated protein 1